VGTEEIDTIRYWQERDARLTAEQAMDAEIAASPAGRIARLQRRLTAMHSDRMAHTDEAILAVHAEYDALRAEIAAKGAAEFAAAWTREITVARRAEWRATLARLGRPTPLTVRQQERRQGWTVEDLKRAVALHGL
jgi:hypothetical protein